MGMNNKKRCNNGIDHGSPANLPQEIILYNILTRVPDKSLNRFRCVCKQWSNSVDDPLFKSLYLSNQSNIDIDHDSTCNAYKERGFICYKDNYSVGMDNCFSFLDIDNKVCKQIPFQLPRGNYGGSKGTVDVSIIDSLNGVLLLRLLWKMKRRFYVYNPASGCWVLIRQDFRMASLSNIGMANCSLAYDPSLSKYKVVRDDGKKIYILTVGEHGSNSWRSVLKPAHYTRIVGKPVYVDYALHWICRNQERTEHILRLDASKEEVSIIKLPVKGPCASRRLLEMGGLLWFIHSVPAYNFELRLWYLKKTNCSGGYRNDEWVVKCNIDLETDISSQQLISCSGRYLWNGEPVVIVMDPKCKLIFTFIDKEDSDNRYICSYDMELKHWELIHAGPIRHDNERRYPRNFDEQEFHYWHDNKNALSTRLSCNLEEAEDTMTFL